MKNEYENYFKPSLEIKNASQRFINALKTGKIEKEILPNTSEDFNVNKVAKSIDDLSKNTNFLAIANQ